MVKMDDNRDRQDQLPGGVSVKAAEALLTSLVNADMPDDSPSFVPEVTLQTKLRAQTQKYWPDLWERHGEETEEHTAKRATEILARVRRYLRSFWKTQDPYERDWHIHRAREWYWRARVQHDPNVARSWDRWASATSAQDARNEAGLLNIVTEMVLDQPPRRTAFESSLFHLQSVASKTRFCPNSQCHAPYFIAVKKGQKFCSSECARPTLLASKRRYWDKKRRTK
jgi:hypothetical protein